MNLNVSHLHHGSYFQQCIATYLIFELEISTTIILTFFKPFQTLSETSPVDKLLNISNPQTFSGRSPADKLPNRTTNHQTMNLISPVSITTANKVVLLPRKTANHPWRRQQKQTRTPLFARPTQKGLTPARWTKLLMLWPQFSG